MGLGVRVRVRVGVGARVRVRARASVRVIDPGREPEHPRPHATDAASQAGHVRGGYASEQLRQDGDVREVEAE